MTTMIDKKVFIRIVDKMVEQRDKEDAFAKSLEECLCYATHINDNHYLEALLLLLKNTIDPDEWINWFVLDHASYDIGEGEDKITVDTPEKLYDFIVKEYPYEPKMISRELFKEVLELIHKQEKINDRLGKTFENYAESMAIVIQDNYNWALQDAIEHIFDFSDLLSYWLYEDGVELFEGNTKIDISTPDALYEEIAKTFSYNKGIKPLPVKNLNTKTVTEDELFDLMKKQLLKNAGLNGGEK